MTLNIDKVSRFALYWLYYPSNGWSTKGMEFKLREAFSALLISTFSALLISNVIYIMINLSLVANIIHESVM